MNTDQGFIVSQKKNEWICNHKIFMVTALLTSIILAVIVLPSATSLALSILAIKHLTTQLLLLSPLQLVYGQKVPQGASCNCIIDYTSSGGHLNNVTGLTIPKVNLLKNQILQNHTGEAPFNSITARSTQLMGILINGIFLGNFTGGPGTTVALNTINVKPNESLGVKVFGGKILKPTVIKGEIISANTTANEKLANVKLVGSKITQFQLLYNKSIKKPVLGINKFLVNIKPGYYFLLMSLGYNTKANNNSNLVNTGTNITDKFVGSQQMRYPIIAIYETILRAG